jgi:hypothetical protein
MAYAQSARPFEGALPDVRRRNNADAPGRWTLDRFRDDADLFEGSHIDLESDVLYTMVRSPHGRALGYPHHALPSTMASSPLGGCAVRRPGFLTGGGLTSGQSAGRRSLRTSARRSWHL